jgi:hypothetical protein
MPGYFISLHIRRLDALTTLLDLCIYLIQWIHDHFDQKMFRSICAVMLDVNSRFVLIVFVFPNPAIRLS